MFYACSHCGSRHETVALRRGALLSPASGNTGSSHVQRLGVDGKPYGAFKIQLTRNNVPFIDCRENLHR